MIDGVPSVTAPTQDLWGRKRIVMMNTEKYLCFTYVQRRLTGMFRNATLRQTGRITVPFLQKVDMFKRTLLCKLQAECAFGVLRKER